MGNLGCLLGREKVHGFHNIYHQFMEASKVAQDENPLYSLKERTMNTMSGNSRVLRCMNIKLFP